MRHLFGNKKAQMGMVGAAVALFITLIISILVYYNIAGSMDTSTVEDSLRTKLGYTKSDNDSWAAWNSSTPVANATNNVNNQAATFYTIAPIIGIVIVAIVVIGYVQRIGG